MHFLIFDDLFDQLVDALLSPDLFLFKGALVRYI